MSNLLVNRLVLNLRRAGNPTTNSTVPSLVTLSFAQPEQSFLGNIGAELRDGSENCDDEGGEGKQTRESRSIQLEKK